MGFQLVPKSVALNDLERRNGSVALFRRIQYLWGRITQKWLKMTDTFSE